MKKDKIITGSPFIPKKVIPIRNNQAADQSKGQATTQTFGKYRQHGRR